MWTGGNISWKIVASPDSITLHPLTIYKAVKSQLMGGLPPTDMHLASLEIAVIKGFNFQDYLAYATNATRIATRKIHYSTNLVKIY